MRGWRDYVGEEHGPFRVVEELERRGPHRMLRLRCRCGRESEARAGQLSAKRAQGGCRDCWAPGGPEPYSRPGGNEAMSEARLALGLRQSELAELAGVPAWTAPLVERANLKALSSLSVDELVDRVDRLAGALGLERWDVLGPLEALVVPPLEPDADFDPGRWLEGRRRFVAPDPGEEVERREEVGRVVEAVGRLGRRRREVLTRWAGGETLAEIGRSLGVSRSRAGDLARLGVGEARRRLGLPGPSRAWLGSG